MKLLYLVCAFLPLSTFAQITLDKFLLQTIQRSIYSDVRDHVIAERTALVALIEVLKTDFVTCNASVNAQYAVCATCALSACQMDIKDMIGFGWDQTKSFFTDISTDFINMNIWKDMGNWFQATFVPEEFKFDDINWDFGGFATDIGNFLTNLWNSFTGVFTGRKRRSVDSFQENVHSLNRRAVKTKEECMGKCPKCLPFISGNTTTLITAICGEAILIRNATLQKRLATLYTLYLTNNSTRLIKEIQYGTIINMTDRSYDPVTVIAAKPGGNLAENETYISSTPYYFVNITKMAEGLLSEVLTKWGQ